MSSLPVMVRYSGRAALAASSVGKLLMLTRNLSGELSRLAGCCLAFHWATVFSAFDLSAGLKLAMIIWNLFCAITGFASGACVFFSGAGWGAIDAFSGFACRITRMSLRYFPGNSFSLHPLNRHIPINKIPIPLMVQNLV